MNSNPLSLSKFENSQNEIFRDNVFRESFTVPISGSKVFQDMYDNKSGVNSQGTPEINKEVCPAFFLGLFCMARSQNYFQARL